LIVASKTSYDQEKSELYKVREMLEKRRAEVSAAAKSKAEELKKGELDAELAQKIAELEMARLELSKVEAAQAQSSAEIAKRKAELEAEGADRAVTAKRLLVEQQELTKLESHLNVLLAGLAKEVQKLSPSSNTTQLDLDGDGKVSLDELLQAVKAAHPNLPDQAIKELVVRLDSDSDGIITLEEVLARLKDHNLEAPSDDK
jgi:chromosome segregation ATPase